ncbi:hypothetical protein KC338_g140 [Hortaea werneckii]|nr:hypothetical protein KC338_g140 [Hortaea werneckii]
MYACARVVTNPIDSVVSRYLEAVWHSLGHLAFHLEVAQDAAYTLAGLLKSPKSPDRHNGSRPFTGSGGGSWRAGCLGWHACNVPVGSVVWVDAEALVCEASVGMESVSDELSVAVTPVLRGIEVEMVEPAVALSGTPLSVADAVSVTELSAPDAVEGVSLCGKPVPEDAEVAVTDSEPASEASELGAVAEVRGTGITVVPEEPVKVLDV